MSNLLEKASIVLTPTAYSDGTLHSVKPVQTLGSELVTNGGFDTDSDWTKGTGWNINNNRATQDGTGSGSSLQQSNVLVVGKTYKVKFEILEKTQGSLEVFAGFPNSNVPIVNTVGTHTFYLLAEGNTSLYFKPSNFIGSIDNVSVKEAIDADFDFTRGSTATRENSSGNIESVAANLPRIDYLGGTGHILLEPQSTNLVTYSEDLSQSSWQKQSAGVASAPIVTSNYSISPDGTLNADRVVFNINAGTTSSDFSQIADQITNNTGDVTNSIFIKSNTTSNYNMSFVDPNANYTSIVVTTEWQRFDATSTTTSTASALRLRLRGSEATSNSADVSVWGAQVEQGSYPTSYIPTSGSTVTRNADVCNNSGSSDLINSTEGVLYAEIAALADDLTFRGIALSDGTTDNRVLLRYRTTSNQINLFIKANGVLIVNSTKALTDIKNFSKIAIKYKSGDIALWVDGVEAKTDTSTFTLIGLDTLNFDAGNGSDDFYGKVKSIAVFKEALTDAQLAALTGTEYNSFAALAAAFNYTVI